MGIQLERYFLRVDWSTLRRTMSQNAILDFESAPVPGRPMEMEIHPASDIDGSHEKEKDEGYTRADEVEVISGVQLLEGDVPTDEEYELLRKVPAQMKRTAIAMCAVEMAERASYYGCQGIFANFV